MRHFSLAGRTRFCVSTKHYSLSSCWVVLPLTLGSFFTYMCSSVLCLMPEENSADLWSCLYAAYSSLLLHPMNSGYVDLAGLLAQSSQFTEHNRFCLGFLSLLQTGNSLKVISWGSPCWFSISQSSLFITAWQSVSWNPQNFTYFCFCCCYSWEDTSGLCYSILDEIRSQIVGSP